jgi:ribosomal protein S17E
MSNNGKGSKPRPYSVSYKKYCDNFDSIFRKNKPNEETIYDSKKSKKFKNKSL